jgi:5-methylcytosine-specific restriction endonuclease McrA
MRAEFSKKVKVQAFDRAKGRCEKCSAFLMPGKFHYDHRIPDAMGGEPIIENCDVLCTACHGEKTATVDAPRIAKTKRMHAKHIGAKVPSGRLQSRGFAKAEPQRRASGPVRKWTGYSGGDKP